MAKAAGSITYLAGYSVPETIDRNKRTIQVVMSTASVDRHGDVVEPKGIKLQNYLQNPVVQWAHDLSKPPIGRIEDITVDDQMVRGTVRFAETPFAKEVFGLYADGFLRAWSIGFRLEKYQWIRPPEEEPQPQPTMAQEEDPDEEPIHEIRRYGMRVLESELVELSGVPVPANVEALAKRFDWLSEDLRKQLMDAASKAFDGRSSKVADDEPEWGKVDKTKLPRQAFADMGEEDKKSTWKYPHHWISGGSMYLHKGGLNAAWAAANGARSGQEASAEVKAHLKAHRKALGLKADDDQDDKSASGSVRWQCPHCEYSIDSDADNAPLCPKCNTTMRRRRKGKSAIEAGAPMPRMFAKSIKERGAKLPAVVTMGDNLSVTLEWESMKENDKGDVTEARVVSVLVTLPKTQEALAPDAEPGSVPTPAQPSRDDGQSESQEKTAEQMQADIDQARAQAEAFAKAMQDVGERK